MRQSIIETNAKIAYFQVHFPQPFSYRKGGANRDQLIKTNYSSLPSQFSFRVYQIPMNTSIAFSK